MRHPCIGIDRAHLLAQHTLVAQRQGREHPEDIAPESPLHILRQQGMAQA